MTAPTLWLYGDVACPWSWLALERARAVAAVLPVDLVWRPVRIGPGPGGDTVDLAVRGVDLAGGAGVRLLPAELSDGLADLGLPFRGVPAGLIPDSADALCAVEFARDLGSAWLDRALDGLFRARFEIGADLGDRGVVLDVCERVGLDRVALRSALQDGRYVADLEETEREADRTGIRAVPTLMIDRFRIEGAAPEDLIFRTVRRATLESVEVPDQPSDRRRASASSSATDSPSSGPTT